MTHWLVPITLVFAGCSRSGGPVEELRSLIEALGNPSFSPSRLGSQVYAVLDEASRSAIDARAAALSDKLGAKVEPDEVLQLHGLTAGGRVSAVEVLERDAERATLEVSFAPLSFSAASAPTEGAPPPPAKAAETLRALKLTVVHEGGRWRIALADLATFVAGMGLEASFQGSAPRGVP